MVLYDVTVHILSGGRTTCQGRLWRFHGQEPTKKGPERQEPGAFVLAGYVCSAFGKAASRAYRAGRTEIES